MSSTRFAILVGIDDQEKDGLKYCVKDVRDISKTLQERCDFKPENIFTIISEYGKENKKALNELVSKFDDIIKNGVINNDDLLFFYFSGHGDYDNTLDKSFMKFSNENLYTDAIRSKIDEIKAKTNIVVLDACFIGASILSKGFSSEKLLRKLHNFSKGLIGIFASPVDREAYQPLKLKNSLLTYYFIDVINDIKNYNAKGLLNIDRIGELCADKVLEYSNEHIKVPGTKKDQIVVRNAEIHGVLPFAQINISTPKNKTNEPKDEIEKCKKLLDIVKNEIDYLERVISAKILAEHYSKPYTIPGYYHQEVEEAVRLGIMDDECYVINSNPDVQSIQSSLDKFTSFISSSKRSENFIEYFEAKYEINIDHYHLQRFWENVYEFNLPK